jgi:hypothetical protein
MPAVLAALRERFIAIGSLHLQKAKRTPLAAAPFFGSNCPAFISAQETESQKMMGATEPAECATAGFPLNSEERAALLLIGVARPGLQ